MANRKEFGGLMETISKGININQCIAAVDPACDAILSGAMKLGGCGTSDEWKALPSGEKTQLLIIAGQATALISGT